MIARRFLRTQCTKPAVHLVMALATLTIASGLSPTASGDDPRDFPLPTERLSPVSPPTSGVKEKFPRALEDGRGVFLGEEFTVGESRSCSVTLTRPLGGETFTAGTTEPITWDVLDAVGEARLTIRQDGYFYSSIGTVPLSDGGFEWGICPAFGDAANYTLELAAYECGIVLTSADFTVVDSAPRPTVSLTSPAGGETVIAGEVEPIAWNTTDPYGFVNVVLRLGGDYHSNLGYVPMADGYVDWAVCPAIGNAADYTVSIASYSCGPSVRDEGDAFEIAGSGPRPTLTVTGPAGGEAFAAGTTLITTWDYTGPESTVTIGVERPAGPTTWVGIAQAFVGRFEWPICPSIGDATGYTVRVTAIDCGPDVEGVSAPFEITGSMAPPTLTLTSPIGGETLTAGMTYPVTWDSTSPSGDVSIRLERNRTHASYVATVPMENGGFNWSVCPGVGDGADYSIGISFGGCGDSVEDSSGLFEIVGSAPPPAWYLTWPVGAEVLTAGTPYRITWDVTNPAGQVAIYLEGGSTDMQYLGTALLSDRGFDWNICPAIGNATDYVIRLIAYGCGMSTEDSSAEFEIIGAAPHPTLAVTSPASGQILTAGASHTITWEVTDPFDTVSILLMEGSSFVAFLAGEVPMSDEQYAWEVCPGIGDSGDYRIRLVVSGCAFSATSEAFEVVGSSSPPTFTILDPAEGTQWTGGTTEAITWDTTSPFGQVSVSLFEDGFRTSFLGSAPMSEGTFMWEIDPLLYSGTSYQIELFAYECGYDGDLSESFELLGRPRADVNGDGSVDLLDHDLLVDCLVGPSLPLPSGCDDEDIDLSGRVDLGDWAILQRDFAASK